MTVQRSEPISVKRFIGFVIAGCLSLTGSILVVNSENGDSRQVDIMRPVMAGELLTYIGLDVLQDIEARVELLRLSTAEIKYLPAIFFNNLSRPQIDTLISVCGGLVQFLNLFCVAETADGKKQNRKKMQAFFRYDPRLFKLQATDYSQVKPWAFFMLDPWLTLSNGHLNVEQFNCLLHYHPDEYENPEVFEHEMNTHYNAIQRYDLEPLAIAKTIAVNRLAYEESVQNSRLPTETSGRFHYIVTCYNRLSQALANNESSSHSMTNL